MTASPLLLTYALSAAGVLLGLIIGRTPLPRIFTFPFLAIPSVLLSLLLWALLGPMLFASDSPRIEWVAAVFYFVVGALAGRWFATRPIKSDHKRGALMQDAASKWATNTKAAAVTLAAQPVEPADEAKHFKIIGTTGTGKSTAIREIVTRALKRGDRAIIADPDGHYLERYYDPSRGDVILNPFDSRAAAWDLFAEMNNLFDADQLSASLIADIDGAEKSWRNYARVFLNSLLRQLHRVRHDDVAELYRLLCVTPVEDLKDLLADTSAGPYLTQDNGRFFAAVRAVATTYLLALEHVAEQRATNKLSVRQWVRAGQGVLFLPYKANEIATLRNLISTWMRLAIFETMTQPESDRPLWFIIDELDALGQIDGLKDALARLRKFGGRVVLGFQSIAQVSGSYGHAEAQTIVENCANTLILRCSASEGGGTAHFASKLIGEREIVRQQIAHTRVPGKFFESKTFSEQHITESAVLPSEIEQLPDLQGYLKLASSPHWRKVKLTHT